jgi:hypothetical protein
MSINTPCDLINSSDHKYITDESRVKLILSRSKSDALTDTATDTAIDKVTINPVSTPIDQPINTVDWKYRPIRSYTCSALRGTTHDDVGFHTDNISLRSSAPALCLSTTNHNGLNGLKIPMTLPAVAMTNARQKAAKKPLRHAGVWSGSQSAVDQNVVLPDNSGYRVSKIDSDLDYILGAMPKLHLSRK